MLEGGVLGTKNGGKRGLMVWINLGIIRKVVEGWCVRVCIREKLSVGYEGKIFSFLGVVVVLGCVG